MSRNTVEGTRRLDLKRLKELGYLPKNGTVSGGIQWSSGGEITGSINLTVNTENVPYLKLDYRTKDYWEGEDDWKPRNYSLSLEKIPCHFGGFKWFVICGLSKNGAYCGRRVRVLYSVGGYFGCRTCADLTYEKCNYGGRYKGFISIPDLDELEAKISRRYYAGKPTRKYRKLMKMEARFENSFLTQALWLQGKGKK
jgi:hypothetical protein